METKKLTQEERDNLKSFQNQEEQWIFELGGISFEKKSLEARENQVLKELATIQESYIKIGKELQEKYGEGKINLETGEITLIE